MALEDFKIEEEKRKKFREILFDLASSQDFLKDSSHRSATYLNLEKLYHNPDNPENPFRHFYSDIFFVLTQINSDDSNKSMDTLGQNLLEIRKGYQGVNLDCNGNLIDISRSIQKLYDHVSLDIARSSYIEATMRGVNGEEPLDDIHLEIRKANQEIEQTKQEQRKISDKIERQTKDYIAILGIFAAVVLAFTGGIAFSTSVLENMSGKGVSIYRILATALVIGLVLVNILFGLFYYIDRLVHRESNSQLKPLLVSNGVIVVLLVILLALWSCGTVELRNEHIYKKLSDIKSEVVITMPEDK